MNVWQLVTNNSTLPVHPSNTFWDHLNNLGGGSGGTGETVFVNVETRHTEGDTDATIKFEEKELITVHSQEHSYKVETYEEDENISFSDGETEIDVSS
ncbi:MAG: hypothetical protein C0610_09280 [Desulfobacteraceae bacterium]|nr:MAG: hypothetical protein C0610_09280 [Desulfobacteraceae bacterium]